MSVETTPQDEVANFHAWLKGRVDAQTESISSPPKPEQYETMVRVREGETILFFFEDKVMKYMADQKNKGG